MPSPIPIDHIDSEALAIELLQKGEVIGVPTDTVYGLACCATNLDAVHKLFEVKSRNSQKPLAICVGKVSDVQRWAMVSHLPNGLLSSLLPGPVTLILRCARKLDECLSLNGKVGIRIPDYKFIQNIANGLQYPLALTSANVSNECSSVKIEEFKSLWNKIGGVFDGGVLGTEDANREASTIVDLSQSTCYNIVRNGIAVVETKDILERFGLKAV